MLEYTLLAKGHMDILRQKLSFDSFTKLHTELESYISEDKSLINLGDIYSAAEAVGLNIKQLDEEEIELQELPEVFDDEDSYGDEIIDDYDHEGDHVQHIITNKPEAFEE